MSASSSEIVVEDRKDTTAVQVMYLLHGLAPFTMWTLAVVAIVIGFVKDDDYRGSYLGTHVSWLARTFWWGLLWIAIAGLVTFILVISILGLIVAWVPFTALFIWYLYRVIRGWLCLNDHKPAPF
ncbi:hypothetical protein BWI17_22125 [Betaproteobacteria bacterium GR16-43]|nr:hypothetical protein BWI17_22125 [Betaproteobacteria bacterium GR16-43]